MPSGFFLGGLTQGFQNEQKIQNEQDYQQGLLKLAQQREQNQQQNVQRAEFMKLRAEAVAHLDDTATQLKIAHPDWGPMQLASNPAIVSLKDMIGGFDKNLGLPPTIDSIVASLAERPSQAVTEGALARAKEGPLGQESKLAQINAHRAVAGQPPIDASGQPANPSNPDLDTDNQLGGKQLKRTGNPKADSIIKGIDNGDLPPNMTGLYRNDRTAVMAGLEDNGINLAQKQLQWKQAEKQIQSLNGPQMTRYVGLNKSVQGTIDEVNGLAKQMGQIGIPLANQANLARLIQTEGNSEKGQLAAKYIGAVNTLKEEFANLANGGYAPTDPAWVLANQQINANYGVKELGASLGEVQKLIKIRLNSIPGMSTLGPDAPNKYTGKGKSDDANDPLGLR